MKYMGDSSWWDSRFRSRELRVMEHEKCLEEDMFFFQAKKTVLDLACGDGRNAVYLAKSGFEVHGVDFSREAVRRLDYFAKRENLKIRTSIVDFAEDGFAKLSGTYDAAVINHYRLPPELYGELMDRLNAGGILWVNGFEEVPRDHPNVKEPDLLRETDFAALRAYRLAGKKSYERNHKNFVRYVWVKE